MRLLLTVLLLVPSLVLPQSANQVVGVNAGGTADEYKTLVQGANVTITHAAGTITIAASGSGGGLGYAIQFECPNQATTTDAQTVYWGSKNLAQQTTADMHRIYIPKAGTVTVCYIHLHSATAGTGENWTMNIRKNNTTDYLVQTIAVANAHRVWSNGGLSISVVAGDYLEIKEVEPTWATNPANVRKSGIIYIE